MIALALFQPEIPQNTGTLLRFAACMGIELHVIEPCGFVMSDKNLLRAGMDYVELACLRKHHSWEDFLQNTQNNRKILLTPQAEHEYTAFVFTIHDILVLGQESRGFPSSILASVPLHVRIPMQPQTRSLNVAIAGAVVASEAIRQL